MALQSVTRLLLLHKPKDPKAFLTEKLTELKAAERKVRHGTGRDSHAEDSINNSVQIMGCCFYRYLAPLLLYHYKCLLEIPLISAGLRSLYGGFFLALK
jgi:hypothetical protein